MKKSHFLMGLALATSTILTGCARYYTPERAANTGGKKCSKRNRITQVETHKQSGQDMAAMNTVQLAPTAPALEYTA